MQSSGVTRLPIVGVMGSGVEAHRERAARLGTWLAAQGAHLLTGGGAGVMEAVARAFCETPGRRGLSIGIIPALGGPVRPTGPNPWIEIVIRTHLPLTGPRGTEPGSRNHINILSSDVIVALPGSEGTASEVRLAQRYAHPLICYLPDRGAIPALPAEVCVTDDFEEVQRFVADRLEAGGRS